MKKIILILIFPIFSFFVMGQENQEANSSMRDSSKIAALNLTFVIIDAPNETFGYEIFSDSTLIIYQPNIPSLPGREGFKTKESAEKVAKLVISKIIGGKFPPTINLNDMKEINVLN